MLKCANMFPIRQSKARAVEFLRTQENTKTKLQRSPGTKDGNDESTPNHEISSGGDHHQGCSISREGILKDDGRQARGVAHGQDMDEVVYCSRREEGTASATSACLHAACSAQPFCFMAELKKVKKGYIGGRTDQFKRKAIDKAIK